VDESWAVGLQLAGWCFGFVRWRHGGSCWMRIWMDFCCLSVEAVVLFMALLDVLRFGCRD
jgi:hypothetical protein